MKEKRRLPEFMNHEIVRRKQQELQRRRGYLFSKRVFDILVSLLLLIPLSVVFLIVAVAIKLEDGGPIFYRQERLAWLTNIAIQQRLNLPDIMKYIIPRHPICNGICPKYLTFKDEL